MHPPTPYWGRNDEPLKSMGAARASLIILEKLGRVASGPKHTRSDATAPVEALLALGWDRRAVACMGSGPYNQTMQKLRQSKLPKQLYTDLSTKLTMAWGDETSILPGLWELWRSLIMEFHLHDHAPMATWTALITNLQEEGLNSPLHLTDLTLEQVRDKHKLGAIPDMPQILWQAATRQKTALGPQLALPSVGPPDVETLLGQIRAKDINDTPIARDRKALALRAGGPADFDHLTPGNKTKWLLQATATRPSWANLFRKGES